MARTKAAKAALRLKKAAKRGGTMVSSSSVSYMSSNHEMKKMQNMALGQSSCEPKKPTKLVKYVVFQGQVLVILSHFMKALMIKAQQLRLISLGNILLLRWVRNLVLHPRMFILKTWHQVVKLLL